MKSKELILRKNEQYVIWEVSLDDVPFNTTVKVDEGCQAFYIKNGQLYDTFFPGKDGIVKSKQEKKEKNIYKLVCTNTEQTYQLFIGVGGIPYVDEEIEYETVVGSNADLLVYVSSGWVLKQTMAKSNVTFDEVSNFLRAKLGEIYKSLVAMLLETCDYIEITTKLSVLSDELKKKFDNHMGELGLICRSLTINEVFFNDEYKAARQEYLLDIKNKKKNKEEQREKRRQMEFEADIIKTLNQSGKEQVPPTQTLETKNCPHCKAVIGSTTVICPNCGKSVA